MLYISTIDMGSALVSEFGDQTIIHAPETDKLFMLSSSLLPLLKIISVTSMSEVAMLKLISKFCLGYSVFDESTQEENKVYLQHLIEQGIIKKTQ